MDSVVNQQTHGRASIPWYSLSPDKRRLLMFAVITSLIMFSDALFSYIAPAYIESKVNNAMLMGLIISTSSIFGIATDIIFGERFKHKKFYFFLYLAFMLAGLPPLFLFAGPPLFFVFIASMAIWGIYFELIGFSSFRFISESVKPINYAWAWGILSVFRAAALTIAPILGSLLLKENDLTSYGPFLVIFPVGLFVLMLYVRSHRPVGKAAPEEEVVHFSLVMEMKIWFILLRQMWPLALFSITLVLVDSTFWTVGTLLSEELNAVAPPGVLLVLYNLPTLFVGFFVHKLASRWGKKRTAFVVGIGSGVMLVLFGLLGHTNLWLLLSLVFLASLLIAVAWPLRDATFEDYIGRLHSRSSNLIALTGTLAGIAYIIGPTLSGYIASQVGYHLTFTIMGGLLAIVGIFALLVVPRKIRIPQHKLAQLDALTNTVRQTR